MKPTISTILRQYLEERERNKNFSEDKFRNLLKELNLSAHQVNDLLIKMDDIQTETQLLNLKKSRAKKLKNGSIILLAIAILLSLLSLFIDLFSGIATLFYGAIASGIIGIYKKNTELYKVNSQLEYIKRNWKIYPH